MAVFKHYKVEISIGRACARALLLCRIPHTVCVPVKIAGFPALNYKQHYNLARSVGKALNAVGKFKCGLFADVVFIVCAYIVYFTIGVKSKCKLLAVITSGFTVLFSGENIAVYGHNIIPARNRFTAGAFKCRYRVYNIALFIKFKTAATATARIDKRNGLFIFTFNINLFAAYRHKNVVNTVFVGFARGFRLFFIIFAFDIPINRSNSCALCDINGINALIFIENYRNLILVLNAFKLNRHTCIRLRLKRNIIYRGGGLELYGHFHTHICCGRVKL